MKTFFMLTLYIDKEETVHIVSCKKAVPGYYLEVAPYKTVGNGQWDNLQYVIPDMIDNIRKNPTTSEMKSNITEEISGIKSYKQFSQRYICLSLKLMEEEKTFEVHNCPRLSDGSYGSKKGVTEEFEKKYICKEEETSKLMEIIRSAYDDGKKYLEKVRRK